MPEPSIDYSCPHCGNSTTYRLVPEVAADPAAAGPRGDPVDRPALPALRHSPDLQGGAGSRAHSLLTFIRPWRPDARGLTLKVRGFAAVDLAAQSGRVLGQLDVEQVSVEIVHRVTNRPVRLTMAYDRRGHAIALAAVTALSSKEFVRVADERRQERVLGRPGGRASGGRSRDDCFDLGAGHTARDRIGRRRMLRAVGRGFGDDETRVATRIRLGAGLKGRDGLVSARYSVEPAGLVSRR